VNTSIRAFPSERKTVCPIEQEPRDRSRMIVIRVRSPFDAHVRETRTFRADVAGIVDHVCGSDYQEFPILGLARRIYIYIYIYIERERERETEHDSHFPFPFLPARGCSRMLLSHEYESRECRRVDTFCPSVNAFPLFFSLSLLLPCCENRMQARKERRESS